MGVREGVTFQGLSTCVVQVWPGQSKRPGFVVCVSSHSVVGVCLVILALLGYG
jgi:hypothetical protein